MTPWTSTLPGRNQPCHCGSGRKYKHCCLEKDRAQAAAAQARAPRPKPPRSRPMRNRPLPHDPPSRRRISRGKPGRLAASSRARERRARSAAAKNGRIYVLSRLDMIHTVEISLRIPSLRARREGQENPATIANDSVGFIKHVELEAVPQRGEVLTMTVGSGGTFQCEVVSSEWHHDKNMFVTACRYSKRSISEAEYQALTEAPDWHVRPIL